MGEKTDCADSGVDETDVGVSGTMVAAEDAGLAAIGVVQIGAGACPQCHGVFCASSTSFMRTDSMMASR
jgi:hypothetical protein